MNAIAIRRLAGRQPVVERGTSGNHRKGTPTHGFQAGVPAGMPEAYDEPKMLQERSHSRWVRFLPASLRDARLTCTHTMNVRRFSVATLPSPYLQAVEPPVRQTQSALMDAIQPTPATSNTHRSARAAHPPRRGVASRLAPAFPSHQTPAAADDAARSGSVPACGRRAGRREAPMT